MPSSRRILTAPHPATGRRSWLSIGRERGRCSFCRADDVRIVAGRHVSERPRRVRLRDGTMTTLRPGGWIGLCARCLAVLVDVGAG